MNIITEQQKNIRRNILMKLLSESGYSSIKDFQRDNGLAVDGLFGIRSYLVLYKRLLNVIELQNFAGHFYSQANRKRQIVWHHSAGWDDARGMYDWWRNDKVFHVATAAGITDDGTLFKGYDEQFWAHHIGMQHWNNLALNQNSVAVEVCNWGALTERDGKLYTWADTEIDRTKAIELNYKGIRFFEAYTDDEIETLKYWTLLNALRFGIPLAYSEQDMFSVSQKAIRGEAGLFTHNSFLASKSDVSPQPKLISMAKELENYTRA